jgi:hypothetical protein
MANSYVEYTTSGSGTNGLGQTTFTAPSKFLNINDIRIKGLNGSTWTELTISSRATTTVTLSATPTSGSYSKIRVFRSSTTESLIDFQAGARLSESDLDTAYQQSLFVAQEVAEDADPEGGSGIGNIVNSQLAGGITNDKLAGGITNDKLAGGITNAQLAGSIADSKLASGVGTSANNLVKLDGSAKLPAVDGSQLTNIPSSSTLVLGTTQATTSGNAVNFTSIPSTVKRISVLFRGISLSGTDDLIIQLGTSGGLVVSGYASLSHYGGAGASSTSGFLVFGAGTTNIVSGIMTIAHMGSNVYVSSHSCKYNTANGVFGGGDVALGGTLDRLTITTTGSNTFDAGSVNIMYES